MNGEDQALVTALLSGAVIGALVTGIVQIVLSFIQRRRELADRRASRKRETYAPYLLQIATMPHRFLELWLEHGNSISFSFRRERAELQVTLLLEASDDVRAAAQAVDDAIESYVEHLDTRRLEHAERVERQAEDDLDEREEGSAERGLDDAMDGMLRSWSDIVWPRVKGLAAAMRGEIHQ